MFTHINEYLNRVGYLHLHILFLLVRTMLNYMTVSCVYIIYVCAHASSASRPPTGRTIHTSPSLALTNGSAFGELLLLLILSPGCPQLPEIQNTYLPSYIRRQFCTNEGKFFTTKGQTCHLPVDIFF